MSFVTSQHREFIHLTSINSKGSYFLDFVLMSVNYYVNATSRESKAMYN